MSAKHTPGPWRVEGCDLIGNSTFLAMLYWHTGRDTENKADAALISAAPDLLAALKWFIDDIDGTLTNMVEFDGNVERARAAIAKAEGGAG